MGPFRSTTDGAPPMALSQYAQFTARSKIVKEKDQAPDELEMRVAQALFDLEVNAAELKADLRELHIVAAKQMEVGVDGKQAIVIFVPFPLLKAFHRIHTRLVRELEKKFSPMHVVIIAQRRILRKPKRRLDGKPIVRPRSRTLTKVHDAILEDIVYPAEIIGKRTRVRMDGKAIKVMLGVKEQTNTEYKLDTFSVVYKKLTGKDVTFQFPLASNEV